jgi:hypothetical protein
VTQSSNQHLAEMLPPLLLPQPRRNLLLLLPPLLLPLKVA